MEKNSPRMRAISAITKELPKEDNHPLEEFSPNLVTLKRTVLCMYVHTSKAKR
jgi:hypothetical protein